MLCLYGSRDALSQGRVAKWQKLETSVRRIHGKNSSKYNRVTFFNIIFNIRPFFSSWHVLMLLAISSPNYNQQAHWGQRNGSAIMFNNGCLAITHGAIEPAGRGLFE